MWNKSCWRLPFAVGALAFASVVVPVAHAQCGLSLSSIKPTSWHLDGNNAQLRMAALPQDGDQREQEPFRKEASPIVGMWHVTFTATTMNKSAIPNTVIDNALVVWHEDRTEIMNSGRPPQDGNFCLGVWKQTGPLTYRLNHFAWVPNNYVPGTAEGVVGQPIGPVHYREEVTLGRDGKHYSGVFCLDQYDTSGHVTTSFTGVLKGTRVTIDTTVGDLL